MKTVFITGADRGIGFSLCRCFLEAGWKVFAGRFMKDWTELDSLKKEFDTALSLIPLDVGNPDSVTQAATLVGLETECLDMLVNCAGVFQNEGRQSGAFCLNINTMGPMRMVNAFLPLMEKGEKRLCFFSSEAGSITLAHRAGDFPYCISKTCLNMAVRLLFNRLQPQGYRFRLYHPGWVRTYMTGEKSTMGNFDAEESAQAAFEQFISNRDWEEVFAMTDVSNEIWPF